jgi:hypothetical protein
MSHPQIPSTGHWHVSCRRLLLTPLPGVLLLNNDGILSSWWFVYADSIRQNIPYSGVADRFGARPMTDVSSPDSFNGTLARFVSSLTSVVSDDTKRASVPLKESGDETSVIGLAPNLSATENGQHEVLFVPRWPKVGQIA